MEKNKGLEWEGPEYHHYEKSFDWFLFVGLITTGLVVIGLLLKNFLLSLIILLGGAILVVYGNRPPRYITFGLTAKGLRIHGDLYPYEHLVSYSIRERPHGRVLIVRSSKILAPRLHLTLPDDLSDEAIEDYLGERLERDEEAHGLTDLLAEYLGL